MWLVVPIVIDPKKNGKLGISIAIRKSNYVNQLDSCLKRVESLDKPGIGERKRNGTSKPRNGSSHSFIAKSKTL